MSIYLKAAVLYSGLFTIYSRSGVGDSALDVPLIKSMRIIPYDNAGDKTHLIRFYLNS